MIRFSLDITHSLFNHRSYHSEAKSVFNRKYKIIILQVLLQIVWHYNGSYS